MTRIETMDWRIPTNLIVSMLVIALPEMVTANIGYWTGTQNDGWTCDEGRHTIPQIYSVNNITIKCMYRHPIRWDVKFTDRIVFGGKRPTYERYTVTLDWKYCDSVNQTVGNITAHTIYFESLLAVHNVEYIDVLSIDVRCVSMKHTAQSYAKWIKFKHGQSEAPTKQPEVVLDFPNQKSCQEVRLASGSKRDKYRCYIQPNGHTKYLAAQYLNCSDWIGCQQLAAQSFKGICKGEWIPTFCDSDPSNCNPIGPNSTFDSGIIYCGNKTGNDPIFYMLFFKTRTNQASDVGYIISEDDGDPKNETVLLASSPTIDESGNECTVEEPFVFDCSAPKFLALEGFQWTANYANGSRIEASNACNTSYGNASDAYMETLSCEVPMEDVPKEIRVTCIVYLQSGDVVKKSVNKGCPVDKGSGHRSTMSSLGHTSESSSSNGFENSSEESSGNPTGNSSGSEGLEHVLYAVAGVVGCLLFTLPILIICYCKVQKQKKQLDFSAEEVVSFMKGTITDGSEAQQTATVLPYDVSLEVPRSKVVIGPKVLGQGAFGKVMKGRTGDKDVAIKTTKRNIDGQYFRALLSELKIMAFVGRHPNVVGLIGANTEKINKQEVYLIFEFCENGNLLDYIRARRDLFVNQYFCSSDNVFDHDINSPVEYSNNVTNRLCSEDLVRWSLEIALGMEFISSKKVYHGDLAARNILLTRNLVAKVGDFGLAKDLKDYSLYVQKAGCPLPLKWMSIESLRDLEFSIQSDVWSFGITLWEIFSLGSTPYPGVEWNFQAWKMLQDGERMERPSHANEPMYRIMMKCWETQPQDRPSFTELKSSIKYELRQLRTLRTLNI